MEFSDINNINNNHGRIERFINEYILNLFFHVFLNLNR